MTRFGIFPFLPARGAWFVMVLLALGWLAMPGLSAAQQPTAPAAGVSAVSAAPVAQPAATPAQEKQKGPTTEELLADRKSVV